MNDEEAVLRCQDGNREAFRHLVESYQDVLYGTAYLMTGNTALSEEHVQEAFLSAWRGIRGFRAGYPVKPWLVRILVNTVMTQRRRQSVPVGESPDLPSLSSPAGIISSRSRNSASSTFADAPGSGASASAGMEVTFTTDLSAADLEEHYREQLEALDWESLKQGAAGPVVASIWRFTTEEGEGRRGLLWVVEGPGVDQRTAFIEVTRPVK